jgi:DnaJ-class molecular chaperone
MPVDTKYYEDLEVTPDVNSEQIAYAFRKLSLQYHPIRNAPNHRALFTKKFSTVCQAYEVLSNHNLKETYD